MTTSIAQISSSNINNLSQFSSHTNMMNLKEQNGSNQATNEVAVKVAVRVRPLNNREKLHQHQPCVRIASDTNQLVIGKDKLFSFDYVLPPKTTQSELYENCVKNLVQSIFEGYNATVFAYGQTGSGKTHTISGSKLSPDEYGIIPRAVNTMFQIINQNAQSHSPINSHRSNNNNNNNNHQNKEYCVKVNFIEIYKEELKDLLDPTDKDLQIREDESGNTIIYGANEVICTNLEEVMACFDSGTSLRHTGSTLMNEQSSRSHSVFTVSIEQRWSDNSSKTVRESAIYDLSNNNTANSYYLGAKFHFVDLAGSERVHRTGNVGDRFKESIHINSGLLALGNVISALSSNDTKKKSIHIPYRESKITRILKDSLGGNANTLMICCISPSSCNLDESINALKYASRARYIKNKPIVNMDPDTQKFVEMQSEIQALREELHRQRTVLSANINHHQNLNDEEMKKLEMNLESAQLEAEHYKKLAKEAFSRFKQMTGLNNSNQGVSRKLADEWLSMFEASKNKVEFDFEDFTKQKISQLETQLKQAQDDLKSDEEIFADKEKEINTLKETISDLEQKLSISNRCLEASLNKEKEQQELMLQLQLQLDKLIQQNKINETKSSHLQKNTDFNKSNKPSSSNLLTNTASNINNNTKINQRAKTAPVNDSLAVVDNNDQNKNRGIYSSPAVFNLERFMQNFRARSQLLTETLEENDNVLQNKFNQTYEVDYNETDELNGTKKMNTDDDEINNENENENEDGKFVRKGTFKVNKPRSRIAQAEMNNKSESGNESNKKLRDLSINIKMKEELIKELVANSKLTNRLNIQHKHKIELLEKEINQYKAEISDLQTQIKSMQQINPNGLIRENRLTTANTDLSRNELELKKKLDLANQKINDLEMKQKENTKYLNSTTNTDKKIVDLELVISKLKQQNDQLQKKIKEDSDKKLKIEKEFEKEQQKLKELEMRSEKQQQILKKKTEDLVQAQKRLRSGSTSVMTGNNETDANKHWVEQEMEKICQEKRQMEMFKEELIKREELIKKKEILLKEKNELEIKKLRSSTHLLNKAKDLEETHSNLVKQRKQLDDKLTNGDLLTPAEERRLIEIDEAIEALEIAIDYENDSIREQEIKLKDSVYFDENKEVSENVLQKLSTIPYEETKYLVKKFFQRIIDLKEIEQKKSMEVGELQIQLEEHNKLIDQLKSALNSSNSEFDRRLIEQKSKMEKNVKLLNQQLNECNSRIVLLEREIESYKEKLMKLKTKNGDRFESDSFLNQNGHSQAVNGSLTTITNNNNNNNNNNKEFYLKNGSISNGLLSIDSNSNMDASMMKQIKVSRKDLRRLTEDELLKRSIKKEQSENF